jgi:uncharacterized protein YdiU (UPF0061 family)
MREARADYTNTFTALARTLSQGPGIWEGSPASRAWLQSWRERLRVQPGGHAAAQITMATVNPVYIPRNHQVEEALSAWADRADRGPFDRLLEVLADPYRERADSAAFTDPAPPSPLPYQTFCGT